MKIEWKTCFKVGITLFLLYLCTQYWPKLAGFLGGAWTAAFPLLIGCAMAYLVNILMSFYERHYFRKSGKTWILKSRRPICMLAAFVTLFALIVLVVTLVLPELVSCIGIILSAVPKVINMGLQFMEKYDVLPADIEAAIRAINWQDKISQIISVVTSGVGSMLDLVIGTLSSVLSWVVTMLLALIFSVYLLSGKNNLARQCSRLLTRYCPDRWYHRIMHLLGVFDDCFHRYIVGQCIEAVILGVLCALGMLALQLPYATMIGALIAFTALIPVAGAYIGGAVGFLMILSVSPVKALVFIIFLVILQQLEGNLIYPRVVGSSLGLPALWVLAAVTVGGGIMGILGMLLGVPVAAALYRLLKEDLNRERAPEPEASTAPETPEVHTTVSEAP